MIDDLIARREKKAETSDYTVNFYNSIRLHSALNYQSPADYERNTAKSTP